MFGLAPLCPGSPSNKFKGVKWNSLKNFNWVLGHALCVPHQVIFILSVGSNLEVFLYVKENFIFFIIYL